MERNKERALAVETLRDDNEIVGIKYFAGTHNRIQRTETGVIQNDIRGIDTCGNQIFAHGHRLVIALLRIIAA
ncbi:hypothetical protein D3C72_2164550 [compost metagenome]